MSTSIGTRRPRHVRPGLLIALTIAALLLAGAPSPQAQQSSASQLVAAPDGQFILTATELVIDGLRIEGGGPAPQASSDLPALRLAADQAISQQLAVTAPLAGRTLALRCPARCRLVGRPARIYVLELTATPVVAGLPTTQITLTPSTPTPTLLALLRLPRLTLRDVRARLVLLAGAELTTPRTGIDLR